jgi:hypothetical protein
MSENLPETTDAQGDDTDESIVTAGDDDIVAGAASENIDLKEITMVDEDNPLAQQTGSTGPQKRQVDEEWLSDFLSDQIYDDDAAFAREYLQNAETACVRAAKMLLRNHPEYGEEWLGHELWVNADTGETICEVGDEFRQAILADYDIADENLRMIELPRHLSDVIDTARSAGYDPTIEVTLYRDDREIHIEDNGIGMTPREYDEAFNYTGRSGSKLESDTGGMFGAGALTFGNICGKEGGMEVISCTRRGNVPDTQQQPIHAYTYLGGFNPMPSDEVPDEFRGTRFEVPILPPEEGGAHLNDFQSWFARYAEQLRVPVLYKEIEAGEMVVKEEYGGESLVESFTDEETGSEPAIIVDRPGEFTIVSGPEIDGDVGKQNYSTKHPDTWLVSMEIDRNTHVTVGSMWNAGVQVHNEQELCVSGPHRGMLRENIAEEDPHDIFTPTPTGDRDRLQSDYTDFWEYVHREIEDEIDRYFAKVLGDVFTQDPVETFHQDSSLWSMFVEMCKHKSMESFHAMRKELKENGELPDIEVNDDYEERNDEGTSWEPSEDEHRIKKLQRMLASEHYVPDSSFNNGAKKKNRKSARIGKLLARTPEENVYLAASTGGNYDHYYEVVKNTHDEWEIVVLGKATYSKYQDYFEFGKLTEVPLKQSDDHEFDVPDTVHNTFAVTDDGAEKTEDPSDITEHILKIYTSGNGGVDVERSIGDIMTNFPEDSIDYEDELVLFKRGRSTENISDHYDFSSYVPIACVTNDEYELLIEHDDIYSYEEYMERARNVVVATEKGPRTIENLLPEPKQEYLTICFTNLARYRKLVHQDEELRDRIKQEAMEQTTTRRDRKYVDEDNIVFAYMTKQQVAIAAPALEEIYNDAREAVDHKHPVGAGIRVDGRIPNQFPLNSSYIHDSTRKKLETKARMLNWHDDSRAFTEFKKASSGSYRKEVLEAFHEIGVDPTLVTEGEIKESLRQNLQPEHFGMYGDEVAQASDQRGEGGDADSTDDSDGSDEDKGLGDLFG